VTLLLALDPTLKEAPEAIPAPSHLCERRLDALPIPAAWRRVGLCRDQARQEQRRRHADQEEAVVTAKIKNAAVTSSKIADAAVTSGKLANNAVTNSKLSDNAVTTGKITDSAVTNSKLAANAVTTGKIADGEVRATDLGTIVTAQKDDPQARQRLAC
jgi:hypothetical protein